MNHVKKIYVLCHLQPPMRLLSHLVLAGHSDGTRGRLRLRSSEHRSSGDHAPIDSSVLPIDGTGLPTWSGAAAASTSGLKSASGPCPRRRCSSLRASTCSAAATPHQEDKVYEALLQLRRAANAGVWEQQVPATAPRPC